MRLYLALKINEIISFSGKINKPLISVLSKVSQVWIDNYGMLGEDSKSLLVKLVKNSSR